MFCVLRFSLRVAQGLQRTMLRTAVPGGTGCQCILGFRTCSHKFQTLVRRVENGSAFAIGIATITATEKLRVRLVHRPFAMLSDNERWAARRDGKQDQPAMTVVSVFQLTLFLPGAPSVQPVRGQRQAPRLTVFAVLVLSCAARRVRSRSGSH